MTASLSLAELEAFDPNAPDGGTERRFCCPRCGGEKPRDATHRSLSANTQTGAWVCHRCNEAGKLREYWTERTVPVRRPPIRLRATLKPARVEEKPDSGEWRALLRELRPLVGPDYPQGYELDWEAFERAKDMHHQEGDFPPDQDDYPVPLPPGVGPGAAYLEGRGIPAELARAAKVKFHPNWYGAGPAVVFPLYGPPPGAELVAAQGRYILWDAKPRMRDAGPKGRGLFVTSGAWDADWRILTEAPIDALSLAASGFPALAALGCELPAWVRKACAFRPVWIATDADEAGDKAAERWRVELEALGAKVRRLRPEGAKDWNELLQRDPAGLLGRLYGSAPKADGHLSRAGESPLRAPEPCSRVALTVEAEAPQEPPPNRCFACGRVAWRVKSCGGIVCGNCHP